MGQYLVRRTLHGPFIVHPKCPKYFVPEFPIVPQVVVVAAVLAAAAVAAVGTETATATL